MQLIFGQHFSNFAQKTLNRKGKKLQTGGIPMHFLFEDAGPNGTMKRRKIILK